jgi:hypothetical protein
MDERVLSEECEKSENPLPLCGDSGFDCFDVALVV